MAECLRCGKRICCGSYCPACKKDKLEEDKAFNAGKYADFVASREMLLRSNASCDIENVTVIRSGGFVKVTINRECLNSGFWNFEGVNYHNKFNTQVRPSKLLYGAPIKVTVIKDGVEQTKVFT